MPETKPLAGKRILCFGDSLTWGFCPAVGTRWPEGVRWTSVLGQLTGATVIEEGLNGRTSVFADPLLPFGTGSDYIEACVASQVPLDLIVIMLGTNDMKTYLAGTSPHASASGVMTVAAKAHAMWPRAQVLVVAPPPIGEWIYGLPPELGMMAQLNEESVDNSRLLAPYLAGMAPLYGFDFLDAGSVCEASQEDAVHLDEKGSRQLAEAIAERAVQLIG